MSLPLKAASIRLAALLGLTALTALPLMAQTTPTTTTSDIQHTGWTHQPPPAPAAIVSQLGLSGSKATQVQRLLEQRQAAWQQFRQAAKANHDQLRQLLSPEQLKQLRQWEHPHRHGPHHGHHGPHHDGGAEMAPAPASSAA